MMFPLYLKNDLANFTGVERKEKVKKMSLKDKVCDHKVSV